jgi:hypothetical protein
MRYPWRLFSILLVLEKPSEIRLQQKEESLVRILLMGDRWCGGSDF